MSATRGTSSGELSRAALRLVNRLKHNRSRAREGLVLVEGVRSVETALRAGASCRFAVVAPRLRRSDRGISLLARLQETGVDVREVSDESFAAISDTDTPQGVMVVCVEPSTGLEDLPPGFWLTMDAVGDPGNAGTLVRAAAAFGCAGVVALDGTVDLWSTKAVRASVGFAFQLPVVQASAADFLERVEALGIDLLVAAADGHDVRTASVLGPVALVIGNEAVGVRGLVAECARVVVSIPMYGPVESLNAGVAGSILLYALSQRS